jgi:hypothetical protein
MSKRFNSFITSVKSQKKIILLIIVVATITIILNTTISMWLSRFHNFNVPTVGTIYVISVKVYGGNITTQNGKTYIDWGTVSPGESTNRSFYVNSTSNVEVVLKLEMSNLTFLDSNGNNVTGASNNYLNLTWNYNNTPLSQYDVVYVTLTLSVSSDGDFINFLVTKNVTGFSFDLHIYPSRE